MSDNGLKDVALAAARQVLADTPNHPDHLHGVVVGLAIDPSGEADPQLVCVVKGITKPVWIALDDDDLESLARYLATHDRDRGIVADLPN